MLARIVGIILGLILAATGYVVAGWGALGGWATHLDLGPFEPHRSFAGGAAAVFGVILVAAALTPRPVRNPRPKTSRADFASLPEIGGEPVRGPADPSPLAVFDFPESPVAATAVDLAPSAATPVLEGPAEPAVDMSLVPDFREPVGAFPAADPEPVTLIEPVEVEAVQVAGDPVAPILETPPKASFVALRTRLGHLIRAEAWSDAGATLTQLTAAAADDGEHALAARDRGDFARGQGRIDDAAEAYAEAVVLARAALAAKPEDPGVIELLAGALAGVGDVAHDEGRLDEAVAAFEQTVALRRSRGAREATDPAARRALSVSLERLADAREDRGHRMRALELYRESHDLAVALAAADPVRYGQDLALTRQRLAELESRVTA